LDATIVMARFVLHHESLDWVSLQGLPIGFSSQHAITSIETTNSTDCFDVVAALALRLYQTAPAPKEVRFTLALLAVRWFAAEHRWVRNDRFPTYPGSTAWFRFFNTQSKLGVHLRDSYEHPRPLACLESPATSSDSRLMHLLPA
jgi:hypothetical protein